MLFPWIWWLTGIADGYPSDIIISDPLLQRNQNIVDLLDNYEIERRNQPSVYVLNNAFLPYEYTKNYIQGNVGPGLRNFSQFIDDGVGVSVLTINELDTFFPSITFEDMVSRGISSFTADGQYFNLANPSIQNARAQFVQSTDGSGTHSYIELTQPNITIEVSDNIDYFPDSGYLYIGQSSAYFGAIYQAKWGIVSYTGKSGKTFTGCNGVRWNQLVLLPNATIIPYSFD